MEEGGRSEGQNFQQLNKVQRLEEEEEEEEALFHYLMNQQFGHIRNHFMHFTDHHTPVSKNVLFNFLNEIINYHRWLTSLCSS